MEESNTEEFQYFEDEPVLEFEISSTNDHPFDVEEFDPFNVEEYEEEDIKGAVHQGSEEYEEDIKRNIHQESEDDEKNIKRTISKTFYEKNINGTITRTFYKCEYCAADFPTMGKLGVHMSLDHPEDLEDFETFECHLCHKKFYDSTPLASHLRRVHKGSIKDSAVNYHKKRYKPLNCKICGQYLRSRRAFEVSKSEMSQKNLKFS